MKALGGSKKVNKALKKFATLTVAPEDMNNKGATAETNSRSGVSKYARNGEFFRSDDLLNPVSLPTYDGGSVTVNRSNHSFFTNFATMHAIFKSDQTFRAFILLHELSHITGTSKPDTGKIKNWEQRQKNNNDKILSSCFSATINADIQGILFVY